MHGYPSSSPIIPHQNYLQIAPLKSVNQPPNIISMPLYYPPNKTTMANLNSPFQMSKEIPPKFIEPNRINSGIPELAEKGIRPNNIPIFINASSPLKQKSMSPTKFLKKGNLTINESRSRRGENKRYLLDSNMASNNRSYSQTPDKRKII